MRLEADAHQKRVLASTDVFFFSIHPPHHRVYKANAENNSEYRVIGYTLY